MPIVDRDFSEPAQHLFVKAYNAEYRFSRAFHDFWKAKTKTPQHLNRIRGALDEIISVGNKAAKFKSSEVYEPHAIQVCLSEPMLSFAAYWVPILGRMGKEPVMVTITRGMLERRKLRFSPS